jgi:hypothetical protein
VFNNLNRKLVKVIVVSIEIRQSNIIEQSKDIKFLIIVKDIKFLLVIKDIEIATIIKDIVFLTTLINAISKEKLY